LQPTAAHLFSRKTAQCLAILITPLAVIAHAALPEALTPPPRRARSLHKIRI
jgi:hypothetical protein